MSSESFKTFLAKVQQDEGLQQELRAAGSNTGMPVEAMVAFAAKKGYAFRVEDVSSELSERELDAVAGGLLPAVRLLPAVQTADAVPSAFTIKLTGLGTIGTTMVKL